MNKNNNIQTLVSLPAATASGFRQIDPIRSNDYFVTSDPPGSQLGSGGGTVHLIHQAWKESGKSPSFTEWLNSSRKLLIHGSGQSRRLPAYAVAGKPLLPVPRFGSAPGQKMDQRLIDLQRNSYERFFRYAPESYRVMVTCGDVLVTTDKWIPPYPEADVLIVGLQASPEEARNHGVMICPESDSTEMLFFLQKPPAEKIRNLAESHSFFLDTGIWLLSEKACSVLMQKSGWVPSKESFSTGSISYYDMFECFGEALGSNPVKPDPDLSELTCAVLPVPDGRFYHFGTNRSIITSSAQLLSPAADQRSFGQGVVDNKAPIIQNSDVKADINQCENVWIENSIIPASWKLTSDHAITNVPDNNWSLTLPAGTSLDFVPIDSSSTCIRFYGFDDPSRGAISDDNTLFLGKPSSVWFNERNIDYTDADIDPAYDIQDLAIFPVVKNSDISETLINWLISDTPEQNSSAAHLWLESDRLSATALIQKGNMQIVSEQRTESIKRKAAETDSRQWQEICSLYDLNSISSLYKSAGIKAPEQETIKKEPTLTSVHELMLKASLTADSDATASEKYKSSSFSALSRLVVNAMELKPVSPTRNILDDQIVWGRSPLRLDLAGGWTDTPPYCFEHGGKVVNVAVDLNGQAPIQVFARATDTPEIVIRSIDLGTEDRITSYDEIHKYNELGSGFSIARAALALAGLSPRFHTTHTYSSLPKQLMAEFGGGIELNLLAAVPKGSGLGTSSILAATLLGTLSKVLGLHWDNNEIFLRTLTLEQMLTSGGGWQDQAGGLLPGLKLFETQPGLIQRPDVRWLPGEFFSGDYANTVTLLYYTGITRVARSILGEIVKNLFLNSSYHLSILNDIGQNALFANDAIQRHNWDDTCEAVRRSWMLNKLLDAGTNPPAVQRMMESISDYTAASKLLGAGGGGYMLILAKDPEAARRIRLTLNSNPPNNCSRFVDLNLSDKGFQVTTS